MIQRIFVMDNPIWTCDEIEDVLTGVKIQKLTPNDNLKELSTLYVLVDGDSNFNIPEEVYNSILKLFIK